MSSFTDIYSNGWEYNVPDQDTTIICSSEDNEFIPVFASNTHLEASSEEIVYKMYSISSIGTGEKTSKFKKLTNGVSTKFVKYGGTTLFIRKGLIYTYYDNGQILYLLVGAAPKQYIYEGSTENGDPVLFIHPYVFTDVKYKNVKYYVNKYFIKETVAEGFEVIITSKIAEKCFNPMSNVLEFTSVRNRNKHLKDMKTAIGLEGEPSTELIIHPEDVELLEQEEPTAVVGSTAIPGATVEIRAISTSGEPVAVRRVLDTGEVDYIIGADPYREEEEDVPFTEEEGEEEDTPITEQEQIQVPVEELREQFGDLVDIVAEFADAEEPIASVNGDAQTAMTQALAEQQRTNEETTRREIEARRQMEELIEAVSTNTDPAQVSLTGSADFIDAFQRAISEAIEELPDEPSYPVWATLSRRRQDIEIVDDTVEVADGEIISEDAGIFPSAVTQMLETHERTGYQMYIGTGGDMEGNSDFLRSLHSQGIGVNVRYPSTTTDGFFTPHWTATEDVTDLDEDTPYFFVDDESEILNYD